MSDLLISFLPCLTFPFLLHQTGFPTRYGTQPAQVRAFWDATGQLWAKGALQGKFAGAFTSTATIGGGQETTIMSLISTLVHLGIVFVPLVRNYVRGRLELFADSAFSVFTGIRPRLRTDEQARPAPRWIAMGSRHPRSRRREPSAF